MRNKILIAIGIVAVLLIGAFLYLRQPDEAQLSVAAVSGARPQITAPRDQVIPTINVADAVGWQPGEHPVAAAGLEVRPFATGLDHPRWLYRLPDGDVLVAESNSPARTDGGIRGWVMRHVMAMVGAGGPSPNRIVLLRDRDGDGIADQRGVFLAGLNSPSGMLLHQGMLYIADTDALLRVPYTAGQTMVTTQPEVVVRYPGGGNHWARNVIAAADGKSLYVSVGSATNIADDGIAAETNRADILEVFPETKTFRIYAAGLRNPNGMAIEPGSQRLWTVVNERDMMGSDLAPDYLTAVELGDHFGWPWYYWGGYPDHRVKPENPALQEYAKRPDYALGPHVAALGLAFAQGARLGDAFADGAFVSEHGSWNRVPASGYKVVYVPFGQNGFPSRTQPMVDVLTGFLDARGNARGRPVGVILDAGGGLLVADDVGNTIWRVTARR